MDIKINIVELASILAHNALVENVENQISGGDINSDNPLTDSEDIVNTFIYKDINADVTEYSEMAQEIFNGYYDYYYSEIEQLALKKLRIIWKQTLKKYTLYV